jgi:hypothetical protein
MPRAIREMTKVSVVNNVRYNPDRDPADINWNRAKSKDQLGSMMRHIMDREVDGKIFEEVPKDIAEKTGIDRVYVLAENAWRACAALELEVERVEATEAKAEATLKRSEALEEPQWVGVTWREVEAKYGKESNPVGSARCKCPTPSTDKIGFWTMPEFKWVDTLYVLHDAQGTCGQKVPSRFGWVKRA